MNLVHWRIITTLLFAAAAMASSQIHPESAIAQNTVAYTGAAVETMGPQGRLENATIVVSDDKIVAVGPDVVVPDNARVVSLAGMTIMPGLVDPYYVYKRATTEPTTTTQARGRRFRGGAPQARFQAGPFTRIADHFYAYETRLMPLVRSGITTANLVIDGRGQSSVANVDPEPDNELIFLPDGLLFVKATNETAALNVIRDGLNPEAAEQRQRAGSRDASNRRQQDNEEDSEGNQSADDEEEKEEEPPPESDETKQLWNAVRSGESPLIVNVNNAAAVAHVLKILDSHENVQLVLVSTGTNVFRQLDDLRSQNVRLILRPGIDTVPNTNRRINVAKMAHQAGIPVAMSLSVDPRQLSGSQHDPLFVISYLVKTGLPREVALQAMTMEPARILGIEKTHGSIEVDKFANLLVFSGEPLEAGSQLKKVILNGRTVHEN